LGRMKLVTAAFVYFERPPQLLYAFQVFTFARSAVRCRAAGAGFTVNVMWKSTPDCALRVADVPPA
jgi:hypothetical protein